MGAGYQNIFDNYTANSTLGARKVVYVASSDDVDLAQADSQSTMPVVGMTIDSANTSDDVPVAHTGIVDGFSGLVAGSDYYVSPTSAGEITATKPSDLHIIQRIGIALSDSRLLLLINGFPGVTGIQGETGLEGIQGETGLRGLTGAQGDLGEEGPQGETGAQGFTGAQGVGETGPQGVTGPGGEEGEDYEVLRFEDLGTINAVGSKVGGAWVACRNGTVSCVRIHRRRAGFAGTTTVDININGTTIFTNQANRPSVTAAQGNNAIASPSAIDITSISIGDYIDVDLDARENGLPQDLSVIIEIKYEGGPIGLQGVTGLEGSTGLRGATGLPGGSGSQGDQGETGLQGIQGETGVQGIQGELGETGVQGVQGDQGETGLQGITGIQNLDYQFFSDQLDAPVGSGWAVTDIAPLSADSNDDALKVRLFDDTDEEGTGFILRIPSNVTQMIFKHVARAETAPGSSQTVDYRLYHRKIPDNGSIGAWSVEDFSEVTIPTNENFQYYSETKSLSSMGIDAGDVYQFEFIRYPSGSDTLSGDYALLQIELEFV